MKPSIGWLVVAALALAPPLAAQDPADAAWRRGDFAVAERLYRDMLRANARDELALHRLALLAAWNNRYGESLALFDRLLAAVPGHLEAAVDRARVRAWQGHVEESIVVLDRLLAANPTFVPALQARGQFLAWQGDYSQALSTFDRISELLPADRAHRAERARVLSWASALDEAIALYDSLVRSDPRDRAAMLGLAQALAWANQLDSASAIYGRLVAADPRDIDALNGVARIRAWAGNLVGSERTWREAVARDSGNVEAGLGLAQTLRWQGRDAAALEELERVRRLAPADRDVRTQLRWVQLAMDPRVTTTFTYEWDSDGNRIGTLNGGGSWRPAPRVELRASGYGRRADLASGGAAREAMGGRLDLWTQFEPGWAVTAGLGLSRSDVPASDPIGRVTAGLQTPGRYPIGATVTFTREAVDATTALIARGVRVSQVATDVRATPPGWSFAASASHARFSGTEANVRLAGALGATRRVRPTLWATVAGRAFGFEKDLSEGYFDPDRYLIGEALLRWHRPFGRWRPTVEGGAGVQQVGVGGSAAGVWRVRADLRYVAGPGREINAGGGISRLGLAVFAPDVGRYRYRSLSAGVAWGF